MKRVLLAGVALLGVLGIVGAAPVHAEDPVGEGRSVATSGGLVSAIVNPVLALVPAPEGWEQRSICIGNEQVDKAWCLYFAYPF